MAFSITGQGAGFRSRGWVEGWGHSGIWGGRVEDLGPYDLGSKFRRGLCVSSRGSLPLFVYHVLKSKGL